MNRLPAVGGRPNPSRLRAVSKATHPATDRGHDLPTYAADGFDRGGTYSPVRHVTHSENNVRSNGIWR